MIPCKICDKSASRFYNITLFNYLVRNYYVAKCRKCAEEDIYIIPGYTKHEVTRSEFIIAQIMTS